MVEQDGRMRGARAALGLIVALLSVVIPDTGVRARACHRDRCEGAGHA